MERKVLPLLALCMFLFPSRAPACSAVFASDENKVLVGNNEDFSNVMTKVWIHPPENGKQGRIYFGFSQAPHIPMGGMNDKGLFFDCFSTPILDVERSKHKPRYTGYLYAKIMEECDSVERALAVMDEYNLEFMRTHQVFFADRHGNWALAEGDVTLRGKGGFHAVTNFRQSKVSPRDVSCERYKASQKMIGSDPYVSVDFVRRAMAIMHVESHPFMGTELNTLYTDICDLTHGVVYLYNFHDYANETAIDLDQAFKGGKQEYELHTLFPESVTTDLYLEKAAKRNANEDLKYILREGEGIQ